MTYSPAIAVPSALKGLTSLFGMGRGEPFRNNHPNIFVFLIRFTSYDSIKKPQENNLEAFNKNWRRPTLP